MQSWLGTGVRAKKGTGKVGMYLFWLDQGLRLVLTYVAFPGLIGNSLGRHGGWLCPLLYFQLVSLETEWTFIQLTSPDACL